MGRSDGYVTPSDAGLDWNVDDTKEDFIGKRSLARDRNVGGPRPHIVGLLPIDGDFVPPDGAALVDPAARDEFARMIGHVTAGGYSPNLKRSIALAQLDEGRSRMGERVTISTVGRKEPAVVTRPVFIDPENQRMRS